ncbi:MAG: PEP-CTERM sorting domain-containing protein [Verrucomicrobia bacterium]|nr:PEP-CTERM sorting domain-containing protein [Verrucomicrobiota bacterium]
MKKLVILCAMVLACPVAFAQNIVEMTLDSTTSANQENINQYVVDELLGVEVAQKDGWAGWLYWDAPKFSFGPVDLTLASELQLTARYHQEDYEGRPAYSDANIWLLLEDSAGTLQDIAWNPAEESWTGQGDMWLTTTRDLSTVVWDAAFDPTQVTKLWVRSTNWGAPDPPNNDYLRFSELVITPIPEPGTIALFGLGLLGLLGIRRKK